MNDMTHLKMQFCPSSVTFNNPLDRVEIISVHLLLGDTTHLQ